MDVATLWDDIKSFFANASTATLAFLKGAVAALEASPQVQAIATEEVGKAEDAALAGFQAGSITTGLEKFAAAQAGVVAQLTTAGVPVVMNQVNLAVEAAVANLNAPVANTATDPNATSANISTCAVASPAPTADASNAGDGSTNTTAATTGETAGANGTD